MQCPTLTLRWLTCHHLCAATPPRWVLDMENPDLFKWLTGQLPALQEVASSPAYAALGAHVQQQLGHNSHQSSQAPSGREWVRGWDDMWKQQGVAGAPAAGQQ